MKTSAIVGGSIVAGVIGIILLVCFGWCIFYACREYYENCVQWRNSRGRSRRESQDSTRNSTNDLDADGSLFSSRYFAVASVRPPSYSLCMDLSNDPPSYRSDWNGNGTDQITSGIYESSMDIEEAVIEQTEDQIADRELLLPQQQTVFNENDQPPS